MSNNDYIPVVKFDNAFDFNKAYAWTTAEILGFLDNVANKPSTYGFPDDRKTDLDTLYKAIKKLEPKTIPTPPPKDPEVEFKQILVEKEEIAPIEIKWNNKSAKFFTVFDLLGVFLSLKGPAPPNATAKNYYLPLVVLYARWCIRLSQFRQFLPAATQITWVSKADHKTWHFALGASLGGFPHDKKYMPEAKKKRHEYIDGILEERFRSSAPPAAKDAAVKENRLVRTRFGACGETYPFLYALADPAFKGDSFGIAIIVNHTDNAANNARYDGKSYWENSEVDIPPCKNCEQLTRWYTLPDFIIDQGV